MNAPSPTNPTPQDDIAVVARLIDLLDLEPLEVDLFRGISQDGGWQRV